ncbi:MAG TPA: hypothetical protein VK909_04225 [Anaerolineales bacterium]|nr:hypothetical protein [Anaerolineales bacterium]
MTVKLFFALEQMVGAAGQAKRDLGRVISPLSYALHSEWYVS